MIDILDLNEKSKEWVSDGLEFLTSHLTYGNALELTDRLIAAEKDAARYRWLRDEARHHMDGGPLVLMTNYDGDHVAYPGCGMVLHESYLDDAIDEAMSVNQA